MFRIARPSVLAAVGAALCVAGVVQETHAAIVNWVTDSGTTIDFDTTAEGSGTAFVNGNNHFVVVPTSGATFGLNALPSTSANNLALFSQVSTAAVTANPNLDPFIEISYIERAYDAEADAWRGQTFFINGQGGGTKNNRFEIGSKYPSNGTDGGATGYSAIIEAKHSNPGTITRTAYISATDTPVDHAVAAQKPRQDGVEHTFRITHHADGTFTLVFDGVVFDAASAPITTSINSLATNGGSVWGFDHIEILLRGPLYDSSLNNEFIITDLEVGYVPIPEPASLGLLSAMGGALVLRRRRV